MKKILISIIVLISICFVAQSQDREPYQQTFNYFGNSQLLDASDPFFQFNRFHRGWHWAYGKKMSEALSFTSAHTEAIVHSAGVPASFFKDSTDLIVNLQHITANGTSTAPLNAMMMIFEPTLKIDTEGEFKTRLGDSTNPIFGFKYINPAISIKPNDRELRLNKNKGYGSPTNPIVVLNEPWSKNELKYIKDFDETKQNFRNYNGEEWYFTINLRRNDLINTIDDSTVLSIRLPYSAFKKDTTGQGDNIIVWENGYIKFDSIPSDNYYSYYKEYDTTRGVYRALEYGNNTTEILIKRSHILQSMDSSITICAKFSCKDNRNDTANYFLNYFHNTAPDSVYHIVSIGIEVKYHGTLNIAIDYMKFETKNAQMLTRGACRIFFGFGSVEKVNPNSTKKALLCFK